MEILFLIGRIIVGLFYLRAAGNHFIYLGRYAGYTASKGVPASGFMAFITGVLLAIGGLSILTGIRPEVGVGALVIFFLPVTFMMHSFWAVQDPMARAHEMVNFTKNLALMGSALMLLAIPQPWPLSLGR